MNISGRRYLLIMAALLALEGVSWLVYVKPDWRAVALVVVGVAALVVSWRRPALVVYFGVAELFVGGKGQLLFATVREENISIRYVLFFVTLIIAALHWKVVRAAWQKHQRAWWPPLVLLVWVIWAAAWGLIQGYPAGRVFTDANAFGMLLAVPLWWALIQTDQHWKKTWWSILAASITLVALKSWWLMVVFGQQPDWATQAYRWVRNTGSGEITPISTELYRVFLQSQLYAVLGGLALLGAWIGQRRWNWAIVAWAAAVVSFLISLSRTFWLGAAVGGLTLMVLLIKRWPGRSLMAWWPGVVIGVVVGYGFFLWAVNFPALLPPSGDGGSAVRARLAASGSTEAANARRNQIQPLLAEIRGNPVFGRGLGAQARYYNPDPRIKGWRETSAFELGYLDWWLKFGLIGLAILGWWLLTIVRAVWRSPWVYAVIPSVAALVAIHATSPYLNHPLGIGWLAVISFFAYDRA